MCSKSLYSSARRSYRSTPSSRRRAYPTDLILIVTRVSRASSINSTGGLFCPSREGVKLHALPPSRNDHALLLPLTHSNIFAQRLNFPGMRVASIYSNNGRQGYNPRARGIGCRTTLGVRLACAKNKGAWVCRGRRPC